MSTFNMRLGQPARCVLAGGRTRRSSQARTRMELSREPGCAGIALAPEALLGPGDVVVLGVLRRGQEWPYPPVGGEPEA